MIARRVFTSLAAPAAITLTLALAVAGCTSPEPVAVPTAAPAPTAVAVLSTSAPSPTEAPTPAPMATQTPSFRPLPTHTPLLPTSTPLPTPMSTPTPLPTATPTPTPPPTSTPTPPSPTSTPAPTPTRTPDPATSPPTRRTTPLKSFADLKHSAWLERNKQKQADEIRQLSWVADGIDDIELDTAEALIASARWYPDVFSALLKKSWLLDDITSDENIAIVRMRRTAKNSPELADQMLRKSWAQDGITRDEARVIYYLYGMTLQKDEAIKQQVFETAIRILAMPFLDSVTSTDALAVQSLERIEDDSGAALLEVMSHPTLSDGITDEEAKIVVVLGATREKKPESVRVLLGGTSVYLEERVIELPLSGEVSLAIIRLRDQVTASMDYLEHSVRTIESFLGAPLPANYIALYFDDATSFRDSGGGTFYGTHITIRPLYDVENGARWQRTPFVIAHEVGHYYFGGANQPWIDEGAAELLGILSENARIAAPIEPDNNPCALFETIAEVENQDPEKGTNRKSDEYRCYYSLGERLFLDLYHTLDEETFRQGLRQLYLKGNYIGN